MKTKITLNDGSVLSFGPAYITDVNYGGGEVVVRSLDTHAIIASLGERAWRSVEISRLDN